MRAGLHLNVDRSPITQGDSFHRLTGIPPESKPAFQSVKSQFGGRFLSADAVSGHVRGGIQDDEGVRRNPWNESVQIHVDGEKRSRDNVRVFFDLGWAPADRKS